MTQEEKQLLIKDLCARVPYVTFVYVERNEPEEMLICDGCEEGEEEPNIHTLVSCNCYGECDLDDNLFDTVYNIKPYLRPMSSMTEDEQRILDSMCNGVEMVSRLSGLKMFDKAFDWLNKKGFDYRGLIEKGLALEAPEGMYN